MPTLEELIATRKDKLNELLKRGINPYPASVVRKHTIAQSLDLFEKEVSIAGRIVAFRGHGKIYFLDVQDESGKIQVALKMDVCNKESYTLISLLDIADIISVQGTVNKTQAGEITIFACDFQIITKAIRPLPDKWHGLKDVEERYRKRYLDTILNADVKKRLTDRCHIIDSIRDFLTDRGFLEVETPTLQPVYGGGFARPFSTHHNALDANFYLRISDEMYLKRLIVGGFEKVYEITKVFRNEGVDHDHNPEFTMFEAQIAYEDYRYGMDLIEEIIENCAMKSLGSTKFMYQGTELDVKHPWQRYSMVDAIKKFNNVDPLKWQTTEEAKIAIMQLEIPERKFADLHKMKTIGEMIAFTFEETVEKKLIQPTIIYDYPIEVSPLAKKCDDQRFTQRFEMFAFGSELGNNYSELNDPIDLRKRFVEEKKREEAGFDEAHQTDYDYLEAIEHGFPPTCGIAIGIDRLVMMLTDAKSIKEVIPFPTLRPENQPSKKTELTVLNGKMNMDAAFAITYPSASVGYAVIRGVSIKKKDNALEEQKNKIVTEYKTITTEQINEYSEIQSYRKMYKKMGVDYHSRRPSPEALFRRVSQGKGLYTINTCVDAYNLIVMKNKVSLGAFDADHIMLPTIVKIAIGDETIDLLGVDGVTNIKAGEVVYSDQRGPYNLDYNYRDSERTKVTEKTKNILLNVDGIYDINEEKVKKSLEEAIVIITKYCGGEVIEAGVIKANGETIPLERFVSADGVMGGQVEYKKRKIVAIVNSELAKGLVTNAIGHMAVSAGRYLDNSWMGKPELLDADGAKHRGISKHPFIILSATTQQIKEIVNHAKLINLFCVDYPQEMFDTGTDEDLVEALGNATDIVYQGALLAGNSDQIDILTKNLQLYK